MALKIDLDAEAVRQAFASCNLDVLDDAVHTCIAICAEFSLTADELAAQWDAYSMNHQVDGAADVDKLGVFRSKLAQDKAAKSKEGSAAAASGANKRKHAKVSSTPVIKREIKTESSQDPLNALYNMKSPEGKNARSFASPPGKVARTAGLFSPSSMQSPPTTSYENRTDAGKTVSEFNAHLKKELVPMTDASENTEAVSIRVPFPDRNLKANAPYMYTPLFERALALDEQLVEYEELIKTHYNLENIAAVADPSPAQVTVVGRIVCEAAEGKLNASVVQLEGSRKTCGGQRVLLDLSAVPNFQVYPGKIVALEGVYEDTRNPMVVKRFLEPVPAPMPTTEKARLETIYVNDQKRPLRVVTASGPFTTTSNVSYLPLNDLLQIVREQKPDVLILVGPFIDTTHASFRDGLVEFDGMMLGFEDIFLFKVMAALDSILEQHKTLQVVMVPSVRDAHHQYVYPQPPFNKKKACEALGSPEHAKRVHMMSNPCTFAINDVVVGVSALDIVMHLSSNELYRAQARDQNRLLRLCQQVVDQRSYYPLFPPPPNAEAPIDLRYMTQFQFERTPDVLILPSMLNRFCGRVHDSICVNPGQLCKGESGGTFAALTVLPLSKDKITNSTTDEVAHFVPDRTTVDIKRI
ncbi:hypothetical protein Poli38472_002366 [Pythium oligandrum]|uniref:DNA polymerase alpha subunit B n=1 Tax=Pythium oligandrum TaxID=41045 RepID=A0A8K1CIP2_PYTOL|nr:hypothetical protein Poli38472_002366 [Pythium oligandrum]|eukprot:TMW63425.1 hypothetical protein Poli38472_002366 [Pythium oligandrum]